MKINSFPSELLRSQVRIKKPSYAQVCQVEAIKVNGFDNTYDTVFNPACDHRAFAAPESLHQVSMYFSAYMKDCYAGVRDKRS